MYAHKLIHVSFFFSGKLKPTTTTTTPIPNTICGEVDPADINFVFSPADMGIEDTAWTTSFISNVVDGEDMDIGFRYGVVSGYCPDDAGFALDRYRNVHGIRERVKDFEKSSIKRLVRYTAEQGFSRANGGRSGSKKVAVLFNQGGKRSADLTKEVQMLTSQGVNVYIASPTGHGGNFPGATTLTGTNPLRQSEEFLQLLCPY